MLKPKLTVKTRHRRTNVLWLIGVFSCLIVIGMENILSSTFVLDGGSTVYGYLLKQLGFLVLGLLAAAGAWHLGYQRLRHWCGTLVFISILMLLAVKAIGITVNGAQRWLGYGAVSFQPSEFAKLAAIICTAAALTFFWECHGDQQAVVERFTRKWHVEHLAPLLLEKEKLFKSYGMICLLPAFFLAGLILIQPDAGTAIVLFVPSAFMLFCSGIPLYDRHWSWWKVILSVVVMLAVIGLAFYFFGHDYQKDRIQAWISPKEYKKTIGYQINQSLIAIGSGGVWGQGIGTGISKFNYLPEAHTDFAYAILCQEWGFLGGVLVVFLFLALIYFGVQTAGSCQDRFGMFLAMGITYSLGGQGLVNMAMVTDLFPVVGVPLPFISYGGSSLILNLISASLLLRVSYDNYIAAAKEQDLSAHQARQALRPPFIRH
ncbi:FtsW/RodA/SpoVE family cell cycle protein [uncultured Megasphaera sp.]|jgi:cell division protein FtsW|uniref:FtsW/RodA/SpoVE family cell cycle protein n=1 Tax=uncultured Megasphaera sp. TaxID=165188 RepID=UPI0025D8988A|nr:FtsW/RodA/SpoVE family cell cycle protein [uncultured Megasphaera sp.]